MNILIRHSVRINTKDVIESWKQVKTQSVRSENNIKCNRRKIRNTNEESQNIDVEVYTSTKNI